MAPPLTTQQKTRIVEWFLKTNSIVRVQRRFKNQYKCKEAPASNTVKTMVEQFRATGNVASKKRGGSKPRFRTPDTVGTIRASVASSSARKSVRQLAFDSMAHTSNLSTHASVQDPCLPVSDNCVPRKTDKVCGGIR